MSIRITWALSKSRFQVLPLRSSDSNDPKSCISKTPREYNMQTPLESRSWADGRYVVKLSGVP